MGKAEQASDPSMEEILSSIRRIIAEDSAPPEEPRAKLSVVPGDGIEEGRGKEPESSEAEMEPVQDRAAAEDRPIAPPEESATPTGSATAAVDSAAAALADLPAREPPKESAAEPHTFQAWRDEPDPRESESLGSALRELRPGSTSADATQSADESEEERSQAVDEIKAAIGAGSTEADPPSDRSGLMSPKADEAVQSAFDQLAHTILSNQARTLEDLVKEMLRPLLRSWLDDNLPVLVERLVRQEIERVSRGRR